MNMKWIVSFTLITTVIGTIFGLVLGGLNPWTSPAEASRMEMETAHQQEMYTLQEQRELAKTQAEIQAIQREQELLNARYEHEKQILAQDVANKQRMADSVINLVIYLGSATGIVAAISTLIVVIAKATAIVRSASLSQPAVTKPVVTSFDSTPLAETRMPISPREAYDPLESPCQRYERRIAERLEELTEGKQDDAVISRMKAVLNPASMSKEQYSKRPLAGD